jgi:hypothetical protein
MIRFPSLGPSSPHALRLRVGAGRSRRHTYRMTNQNQPFMDIYIPDSPPFAFSAHHFSREDPGVTEIAGIYSRPCAKLSNQWKRALTQEDLVGGARSALSPSRWQPGICNGPASVGIGWARFSSFSLVVFEVDAMPLEFRARNGIAWGL